MSAEQAWEDMRAYNIRLEERAREAERALGEMREALLWIQEFAAKMPRAGADGGHTGFVHIERRTRAALRSEDTSDES